MAGKVIVYANSLRTILNVVSLLSEKETRMTGNNIHGTLVQKVESASITSYSPGFRAVMECMLDLPRTTAPAFTDVAIRPNGVVMGYDDRWFEVLEEAEDGHYQRLTRFQLIEAILNLCFAMKVAPRERTYIMDLVKCMDIDGERL